MRLFSDSVKSFPYKCANSESNSLFICPSISSISGICAKIFHNCHFDNLIHVQIYILILTEKDIFGTKYCTVLIKQRHSSILLIKIHGLPSVGFGIGLSFVQKNALGTGTPVKRRKSPGSKMLGSGFNSG